MTAVRPPKQRRSRESYERVLEAAHALGNGMGAEVDERIYPRMGHTVNRDEIEGVRALLARVPAR